jgi:hypothetical protein
MRLLTTIILALLLGVVILLIAYYGEETKPVVEEESPLFPGLVTSSVDRIEFTLNMGRETVLKKEKGSQWRMEKPFDDDVRLEMVNKILEGLQENRRTALPLSPEEWDLPAKGLDPPSHYLRFHDGTGDHTLLLGSRDPFKSELFVMIEGDDTLYRTGSNLLNLAELNPEDLRDERIFKISPFLVTHLWLEGPKGMIMHAVKRATSWEIREPIRVRSNGQVQNLINRLTRLQIQTRQTRGEVTDEIREVCGFNGPLYKITLQGGPIVRQAVIEAQGLGPNADHLCTRDGEEPIYSIALQAWNEIPKKLATYRSREILHPVREDLQTLKIWQGDLLTLELQRMVNAKFFEIRAPFKAAADNVSDGNQTPIYYFLTQVDGIRIQDFVSDQVADLKPYDLDPPALEIEVMWREAGVLKTARIGFSKPTESDLVHATRLDKAGEKSVYTVKAKEVEPLMQDAVYLRDRRIFPQDIGAVQAVTFSLGNKNYTIRRDESRYFADDPQSRFQVFLNEMAREQVVRYEAGAWQKEDSRFQRITASVEMEIQPEGESPITVLAEVGEKIDDCWYGRISSLETGIFLLEDDFMKEYEKLFEDLP